MNIKITQDINSHLLIKYTAFLPFEIFRNKKFLHRSHQRQSQPMNLKTDSMATDNKIFDLVLAQVTMGL